MLAGGLALAAGKGVNIVVSGIEKELNKTPYQRISSTSPGLSLDLPEKSRPKIGLALGGGGLKGFAHFGVILSLIRNNIPIDYVAGTSIGAIIGAIYCTRKDWTVDEWEKVIQKVYNIGVFDILDTPDISNGAFQKHNKLEKLIKEFIPVNNFNQLKVPLSVVATSLTDGEKEVFTDGNLIESLLASSALPCIYPSVPINNEDLVDGGPKELVPTRELAKNAQYIIASDVSTVPYKGYRSKNLIKNLLYSIMLVQRSSVEDSLEHSNYTFFGNQSGDSSSIEECKSDIQYSYNNVESEMDKLINSIEAKAKELNLT